MDESLHAKKTSSIRQGVSIQYRACDRRSDRRTRVNTYRPTALA